MAEFERVLNTTLEAWAKGLHEEQLQNRVILALLEKKKRIKYNANSYQTSWTVGFKDHALTGYGDMETISFSRVITEKKATIDYRGYIMTDAVSEKERLMNKGKEAIVSIFEDKLELMKKAWKRRFGAELYIDGGLAANAKRFEGIDTIMGEAGTTNSDEVGVNSGSYANINQAKGTYGGSAGDAEYDFWSSVLINTGYNTSTWSAQGLERLRTGIKNSTYAHDDKLDLVLLNRAAYVDLLNLIDGSERIIASAKNATLTSLGFGDHIEVDGCPVTWDFDVPTVDASGSANPVSGYGWNFGAMNLLFLQPNIVKGRMVFDEDQLAYKFLLSTFGNCKFTSPRRFAAFKDFA